MCKIKASKEVSLVGLFAQYQYSTENPPKLLIPKKYFSTLESQQSIGPQSFDPLLRFYPPSSFPARFPGSGFFPSYLRKFCAFEPARDSCRFPSTLPPVGWGRRALVRAGAGGRDGPAVSSLLALGWWSCGGAGLGGGHALAWGMRAGVGVLGCRRARMNGLGGGWLGVSRWAVGLVGGRGGYIIKLSCRSTADA